MSRRRKRKKQNSPEKKKDSGEPKAPSFRGNHPPKVPPNKDSSSQSTEIEELPTKQIAANLDLDDELELELDDDFDEDEQKTLKEKSTLPSGESKSGMRSSTAG